MPRSAPGDLMNCPGNLSSSRSEGVGSSERCIVPPDGLSSEKSRWFLGHRRAPAWRPNSSTRWRYRRSLGAQPIAAPATYRPKICDGDDRSAGAADMLILGIFFGTLRFPFTAGARLPVRRMSPQTSAQLPPSSSPSRSQPGRLSDVTPAVGTVRKWLYVSLGCVFVGLAGVGVVLPGIPTTPFLILASYFFIRSSPLLHRKLLRSKTFGPILVDWHRHRALQRRVKLVAVTACTVVVGVSLTFGGLPWPLRLLVGLAAAYGIWFVARLPTIPKKSGS